MSQLHRLSYVDKRAESYEGKTAVCLTNAEGTEYPLDSQEFTLAQLFDGNRSQGEVLDAYFKLHGSRLAPKELETFVNDLVEAGLLVEEPVVSPLLQTQDFAEQAAAGGQRPQRPARSSVVSLIESNPAERPSGATSQARRPNNNGERRSRRRPEILLKLPVKWLLPLGNFITLPLRHRALLYTLFAAVVIVIFGLTSNSALVGRDLARFSDPLTLFQTLIFSMITVNLMGQLARVSVYHRLTLKVPRFGIAIVFSVIPRFYTDLPVSRDIKEPEDKRKIYAASLVATVFLFVLGSLGWLITKNTATQIPVLFISVAMLAVIRFALSVNPLAERPGYRLFASWVGHPGLRQRAIDSVFNRKNVAAYQHKAGGDVPAWALYTYGALVIGYLVLLVVVLVWFVGGALERQFSGTGVLLFVACYALLLFDPFNRRRRPNSKTDAGVRTRGRAGIFGRRGFLTGMQRRRRTRRTVMQILFLAGFIFLVTRPYIFEPSGALLIKPLSGSDVRSVLRADIDEIYVEDGQYVEKGTLLAKLSDIEEVKNIGAIEARIKQLEAKLEVARQGAKVEEIALARQQLTTADARLKFSTSQAARFAELVETQLVSQQQYENAEAEMEVDAERVEEARRNLELVESGSREEELDGIVAELAEQQADLDYFDEKLDRTRLKATSSGHVVSGTLDYKVGDYLDLGDLLLRIEDTSQVIAEVAIPESDIGDVEVGAQARIKIWKFPDREFRGQVDTIAPTAEMGEYGNVVLVRILLPNPDDALRAGLTGHGKITGPEMPAYEAFTRAIVRFFRIEVWSWLP